MRETEGFTLIETLIAFTLLAIVLAGTFQVFESALAATGRADARLAAIAEARAILAEATPEAIGREDLSRPGWSRSLTVSTAPERPGLFRLEARAALEGAAPVVLVTWRPTP